MKGSPDKEGVAGMIKSESGGDDMAKCHGEAL